MHAWSSPEVPMLDVGARPRVRAFDSAARGVVPVGPQQGTARLYVCGITPYDATHLGHANTYLAFDLLQRAWRDAGLDVVYAQNVTDVDDPLLERAEATGRDWEELAQEQTALFRSDMEALRIIAPQHYVGAVEAIPDVVAVAQRLQEAGAVYAAADPDHPDLYFRSDAAPGFGQVSHLGRDEMIARFRDNGGDPDRAGKRDPLDCLIWRLERAAEPSWDSPLGRGRPGWHIECTAIAQRHLGAVIDVQGGGSDLAFPHHEMCAAEGRVATGHDFAAAYVHAGMVALDGEKMSKSKGNLVFVSALRRDGVDPMAIRLALLAHHYRADWEWFGSDLERARARLSLWRRAVSRTEAPDGATAVAAIRAALCDDLDAPRALDIVDTWARGTGSDADAPRLVARAVDALLGVGL